MFYILTNLQIITCKKLFSISKTPCRLPFIHSIICFPPNPPSDEDLLDNLNVPAAAPVLITKLTTLDGQWARVTVK